MQISTKIIYIIIYTPIWTNLQIFSHLNHWKEEDIVNLKWVSLCNKTMSFSTVYKWSFIPLTLLNVSSFTSNSYFVSINSVRIIRNCRVVTIQMKLVLNYLSTAEETAASEVVLDAFTVWWSWGAINAFTLQYFKCINNFIRLMLHIFLNIQINVEKMQWHF